VNSGLFITLFDEETLKLYLARGVYGFHMSPVPGEISTRSRHFAALGDYACAREGTHVFFFLKRKIVYGGQIIGSSDVGAFYLNGPHSPMGRISHSELCWDESNRDIYSATETPGIFTRPNIDEKEVCQPYLFRFEGDDLVGEYIISDQLYFELGEYPYPLPSNSIAGMSFCTLTPGETNIILRLLNEESEGHCDATSSEPVHLLREPTPFHPNYGIRRLADARSEAHLELSIIANPNLVEATLQPDKSEICRQIPISPFKPSQMDRADICYYSEDNPICDGTIPNIIIELKINRCGINGVRQVLRYMEWLKKRLGPDADDIKIYLFAPSFTRTAKIPVEYRDQIEMRAF